MTKDKEIVKRIMIAAAGSGSGKTVITCALLSILKDRGMNPVSFKCGPDYIDPMFHRSVLGIDSHNLDTYLAGPDGVASVFEDAVSRCGYGFAVIEGVMGIYDGMTPGSLNGSCYEIAGITKTPIVLVADASGTGQTVASLIKGVLADDGEAVFEFDLIVHKYPFMSIQVFCCEKSPIRPSAFPML